MYQQPLCRPVNCDRADDGQQGAIEELSYELNGRFMTITYVADCDARWNTMRLSGGPAGSQLANSLSSGDEGGIRYSSYTFEVEPDTVYELETASHFGSWIHGTNETVHGRHLMFMIPGSRTSSTLQDLGVLPLFSADEAVVGVVVMAEKAQDARGRPGPGWLLGMEYVGEGLFVAALIAVPTVLGAVITTVGLAYIVVETIQYNQNLTDLQRVEDEANAKLDYEITRLLAQNGLNSVQLTAAQRALFIDRLTSINAQIVPTEVMLLDTLYSVVGGPDWDGDGIPNRLDPSKGTDPDTTTNPDDRGGCEDSGNCPITEPACEPNCVEIIVTPAPRPVPIVPVGGDPFAKVDANGRSYCESASSDPDGDGWGWENNASCVVR